MPQVVGDCVITLVPSVIEGEYGWAACYEFYSEGGICLRLDIPRVKAEGLDLVKEVEYVPEWGHVGFSNFHQAVLQFGTQLDRRGYLPAGMTVEGFAQEFLDEFSGKGGDD